MKLKKLLISMFAVVAVIATAIFASFAGISSTTANAASDNVGEYTDFVYTVKHGDSDNFYTVKPNVWYMFNTNYMPLNVVVYENNKSIAAAFFGSDGLVFIKSDDTVLGTWATDTEGTRIRYVMLDKAYKLSIPEEADNVNQSNYFFEAITTPINPKILFTISNTGIRIASMS